MPEANDWNAKTIAEFRANEGRVGGHFEGAPIVLVQHRGRELTGDERDRVYHEQARRYPGFADYARQTAGIRTIPVLELRRS
jgi:hypothetical protein